MQLNLYTCRNSFPLLLSKMKKSKSMTHKRNHSIQNFDSTDPKNNNQSTNFHSSSSSFFHVNPTIQVDDVPPDFIWKLAFSHLPKGPPLPLAMLSSDDILTLLQCCLLSNEVYKKMSKRHLPISLQNIVIDNTESDYYKIPYLAVNSEQLDTIFIACRGSYCMKDFHVDFNASAIKYMNGYVHEGAFLTAINIFTDIREKIANLSAHYNQRKIIITGHSLGASVAAVLALFFHSKYPNLKVHAVAFAPMASFSREVWESTQDLITSYINFGDIVPFISYYNAYHMPKNAMPKLSLSRLKHWSVKKSNHHSKRPEFRDLIRKYTRKVEEPDQLIPPGKSFLFTVIDKKTSKVCVLAVNDPFAYFGHFLKDLSSLQHRMTIYKHNIIRYTCEFFDDEKRNEIINSYSLFQKHNKDHKDHSSEKDVSEQDSSD